MTASNFRMTAARVLNNAPRLWKFRKRLRPTFAALGDISIVISFPSSSTRGFCITTVALEREVFEKGRVCACGALEVDGIGRDTVV